MPRTLTVIIKPTHACNLACKYCYVDSRAEKGRMDIPTLEAIMAHLCSIPELGQLKFIWHGGEPLLMGLGWFEEAIALQQHYVVGRKVRIENSIQSNLTLLTSEMLDFFEKHSFQVGTSMDGPEHVHNITRVYPDGAGTFRDVWNSIQMVKERNVALKRRTPQQEKPQYLGGGVITVLTKHNYGCVTELYDFFKSAKISMKINPLLRAGRARSDYDDLGISPQDYGNALTTLFERWFYDKESPIDVDPLSEIIGNLLTGKPRECTFTGECRARFISVGPHGDVYPCGRFDGMPEFWLGNLTEDDAADIMDSPRCRALASRNPITIDRCSACSYIGICNAGCMHNAYVQRGTTDERDFYCDSYLQVFRHLENALDAELRNNATETNNDGDNSKRHRVRDDADRE